MADFNYSDEEVKKLIEDIHAGSVNPLNLPEDFYLTLGAYLDKALEQGFGKALDNIQFGTPDRELMAELRENIYMFSAARTFQQTVEMSDALVNEQGEIRSLKEFRQAAEEIYTRYNGGKIEDEIRSGWLDTEYNTAVTQAMNAKKWERVQQQKDVLPYLRRVAVQDELECEICSELDGITAPVDDPIWGQVAGAAHFNCRCIEEQLDKEEGEKEEWEPDEMEEAVKASNMPDEFKYNPGADREVFSASGESKHPYFTVPKEYKEFAKNNFDLPLPIDEPPNSLTQHMTEFGQLMEKRQKLHDKILRDIEGNATPVAKPTVYMNGGGTASGKTAVTDSLVKRPENVMNIDSDKIKDMLPEYRRMLEERDKTAASYVHEESSMISKQALKTAIDGKYNAILDGTGDGSYESLERKVMAMKENGARVVADYVSMNTNLSLKIQEARFEKTGRFVPEKVLRETHKNVSIVVPEAIKNNLFDEFRLWDTNLKDNPRLVAEMYNGKFKVLEPDLWQDFLDKAKQP